MSSCNPAHGLVPDAGDAGGLRPSKGRPALRASLVARFLVCTLAGTAVLVLPPQVHAARARTTKVAAPCKGSSNPTFFSSNHRLEKTSKGRFLAIYDPHGNGQRLAWRNRRGRWRNRTRGKVNNGFFPSARSADRPGSIVVGRDAHGREHAWVVWAADDFTGDRVPLLMRRLTSPNAPRGPRVGPMVKLAPTGSGHARPDIGMENGRIAVVWVDRTANGSYELAVGWITALGKPRPDLVSRTVLLTSRGPAPAATLVSTPDGLRVVASTGRGSMRLFSHDEDDPLTRWRRVGRGASIPRRAKPTATVFARKRVVAAASGRRGAPMRVVLFRNQGRPKVQLRLRGYTEPSLTRVGNNVMIVMVRERDGRVVSRTHRGRRGWTKRDRVEIGRTGNRQLAWPNTMRRSSGLSFIVQGARCRKRSTSNGVLAVTRR
jgi:hypothetical protein